MNRTIYLAYGSNLNRYQMAQRCPTAKVLGPAVLTDYRLLFKGRHANSVATVEPCEGSSVPVLLWSITTADEKALDLYEGFPRLYRKETVKVKFEKKTVKAMVYIMNDLYPCGMPSAYYYNTILQGYKTAGFAPQVLKDAVDYSITKAEN